MGHIIIGMVISDVGVDKVSAIWTKLKALEAEEPKLKITAFSFGD